MDEQSVRWIIGIAVTIALGCGGGLIKYLFRRMDKHEQNTIEALAALKKEVEDRRIETRDHLLDLINVKFDAIWESLRDLTDKVS